MKTLEAHEQSLSKIFSDDYVFSIPGYQRPYSWTVEQAGDLISDLLDFIDDNGGNLGSIPPYFLGSIVLIKKSESPDAEVVDGQQRLTTLTLLLSAARHCMDPGEDRNEVTALLMEKASKVRKTESRYRLCLREKDRQFFHDFVQEEGGFAQLISLQKTLSDSQKKLQTNAQLFCQRLSSLGHQICLGLVQFIVNSCYLVTVCTPDENSAFRIFNVLNSRGLDLTPTDILKSKITGKLDEKAREKYTKIWEDLEEQAGRREFSDLFSHIRMIFLKSKPKGTLIKEFEDHVPMNSSIDFMDNLLRPLAEAFREITQCDCHWNTLTQDINDLFHCINRVGFKDWMPPALAFMIRHQNDPVRAKRFFQDLERLIYSLLIQKAGINERIERFSKLTAEVERGESLEASGSALQLSAIEINNTLEALSGPIYATHSAQACSRVLLRLDSLLSGGGARYDHPVITIEHVLPQNPASESQWAQWFPDPDIQVHWLHRIGNLALLTKSKNSGARNFDFNRKKEVCFKKGGISPFVLTTQVIDKQEWTPSVVTERHSHLIKVLAEHWRLVAA